MAELNPIGKLIHERNYAVMNNETWQQTCLRVALNVAYAYHNSNKTTEKTHLEEQRKIDAFYNMINELVFIPGGDILANVGTSGANKRESTQPDITLVEITDAFMKTVIDNTDLARESLYVIAEQAYKDGKLEILFSDRINEDNMVSYLGDLAPCVGGDTLIQTVNEGARPIQELAEEGYDVLVYTWNRETKLPEVGIMRDIRKTRENAKVLKVIFDSGLEVICTPDHNFYAIRGKKVEAKDLKIGQSIRAYKGEVHRDGHVRVHGWANGRVKHQYTARMVWEYFNGEIPEKQIIHHRNMIENDNNPENLEALTISMHNSIHYAERRRSGFGNHQVVAIKEMLTTADVYNGVVDNTHAYIIADPDSTVDFFTGIVSANCGELDAKPKYVGSINLHKMYDTEAKAVNWEFLEYIVRNAVTFLDSVYEVSEISKELRRIGLGVMGWAQLLDDLDIPYDSVEALKLARNMSWFITYFAYLQSMTLVSEHGTFELYDPEKVDLRAVDRVLNCSEFAPRHLDMDDVRQHGFRNVSVTNIAPDNAIAQLAGVSAGIKPIQKVTPDWYVKMQADWQLFIDSAISEIVELPQESTAVSIYEAIAAMWVANLKGGVIHRTNSLNTGVK